MDRIEQIRKRLVEAWPEPWELRINGCTTSILMPDGRAIALLQQVKKPHVVKNAALIANAPADLRYLLERLDEAVRLLELAKEYAIGDLEYEVDTFLAHKGESNENTAGS